MDTKTHSNRMQSLLDLYDMHTKFFHRVIIDITDTDAQNRLNTQANHIAWLAGSLVEQRFELAKYGGIDKSQKAHELFKEGKGIQEKVDYPPLKDFQEDWDLISPVSRQVLIDLTDEKLDGQIEMGDMKMPLYDMITFIIYREANCIGQIALWRRLLGYEPMKYD